MMRIFSMARAAILFLISAFVLGQNAPLQSAAYNDEVIFWNGQKLVGEIKGLSKGYLSFNTDETGTISVKWVKAAGLSSIRRFRLEIGTGQILVGSFERASEEGKVVIATETGKILMALDLIVVIEPFEIKFLDRFKGDLNFGFSLQRAQSLTTYNLGAHLSYQETKWNLNLSGSSYLGKQEAVETTTRNDVLLTFTRDLKKRWLALALSGLQQNTELGLSSRVNLGGGIGNRLVLTNNMILSAAAGAVAVEEKYSDAESSTQNAEAIVMGQFSAFRRTFPKLDFVFTPMVFPGLTDWGRVRFELTTNFSYEVFSDFYIGLDGFYSFDNRPPTEATSKQDYGISTTITWKFNK